LSSDGKSDDARAAAQDALRDAIERGWQLEMETAAEARGKRFKLHEPTFGVEEILAAVDCMLTSYVTMGKRVAELERVFADYVGLPEGVSCNSGSSANLLAIGALANGQTEGGLRPGDEVIVPALAWSTTVWPLVQHGLVPVIVDIDPLTLNIDPNEAERAVSDKTRAILPVHVYGNPCDMDALQDLCQRHDLILIEDVCEAMGGSYKGRALGSFGRVSSFSFYFSHHITTFEGGMCLTGDEEIADTMRILRSHGWIREAKNKARYTDRHPGIDPRFLFVNTGYNLRLTEVQAAVGLKQVPKLDGFLTQRREAAALWESVFAAHGDTLQTQRETPGGAHARFGFPVTVKPGAPYSCAAVREHLDGAGVETRPIICGNIALQPGLHDYDFRTVGDLACATNVMRNSFSIGNHHAVRAEDVDWVRDLLDSLPR
jgi:CDP-6-deoxy-D-xylo-4-hexulose-3-dehydrase